MSAMANFGQDTPLWNSLIKLKEMQKTSLLPAGTQQTSPIALRVPLAVGGQDCYRLFSSKVQINSPYRVERESLQPFLDQRKKILLVPSRMGKMWATLTSIHEDYLIAAADRTERLLEERSRIVLVVFPVLPERAYVLQTRVGKLYVDRVILEYQDPRYEPRRRFSLPAPISLQILPRGIGTALEQEQLHLMRELRWLTREPKAMKEGHLTDLLHENMASPPSAPQAFDEIPPFSCSLRDISCGGVSLNLNLTGEVPQEGLLHSLLLLHIPLSPVIVGQDEERVAFTLKLLGVVQTIRPMSASLVLHIQFLERLPEEFDSLFKRMERGSLTITDLS